MIGVTNFVNLTNSNTYVSRQFNQTPMRRMPDNQLFFQPKQEERQAKVGNKKTLFDLPETYQAQRNKVGCMSRLFRRLLMIGDSQ